MLQADLIEEEVREDDRINKKGFFCWRGRAEGEGEAETQESQRRKSLKGGREEEKRFGEGFEAKKNPFC